MTKYEQHYLPSYYRVPLSKILVNFRNFIPASKRNLESLRKFGVNQSSDFMHAPHKAALVTVKQPNLGCIGCTCSSYITFICVCVCVKCMSQSLSGNLSSCGDNRQIAVCSYLALGS